MYDIIMYMYLIFLYIYLFRNFTSYLNKRIQKCVALIYFGLFMNCRKVLGANYFEIIYGVFKLIFRMIENIRFN